MFARIVHADWSKHWGGRWYAEASRTPTGWQAAGPWPVGDVTAFVDRLLSLGRSGPTLAAFDFPIGLPLALVAKPDFAAFADFRAALDAFGGGAWSAWFAPAPTAAEIGPRRPFYPASPGAAKTRHLLEGLGIPDVQGLMRGCERGGAGTRAAGCMFWLVGAKTVGKAAIHGWQEVVRPALARGAALWPFDGDLDRLAAAGGLVLAESYPADALVQIGVAVAGKGDPTRLAAVGPNILAGAEARRIALSAELRTDLHTGFAARGRRCGDAFDAVVGLLAAIAVADRERPDGAPATADVRRWEGWILGRR